uniref:Uncharacterized protein n=1 Tax=Arundo donax TaxID=35708 RepID=A0A0A9D038_ARUDO
MILPTTPKPFMVMALRAFLLRLFGTESVLFTLHGCWGWALFTDGVGRRCSLWCSERDVCMFLFSSDPSLSASRALVACLHLLLLISRLEYITRPAYHRETDIITACMCSATVDDVDRCRELPKSQI